MKKPSLFFLFLLFCKTLIFSDTLISGEVSGQWDKTISPIYITGDLHVAMNQVLYIKSGVNIIFKGPFRITVDGSIKSSGIENDSILFSSDPGIFWSGFFFVNNTFNNQSSSFNYVIFENASSDTGNGSLMLLKNSNTITISNSSIRNNRANNSGGAIYCSNSSLTLDHNYIFNNRNLKNAAIGGFLGGYSSNIVFKNNIVIENKSISDGGAIYLKKCNFTCVNNRFYNNYSGAAGGAIRTDYGTNYFTNNLFASNFGSSWGGAILVVYTNGFFRNNSFVNNSTKSEGGGVYISGCSPTFVNTLFCNNKAEKSGNNVNVNISQNNSIVFDHCASNERFDSIGTPRLYSTFKECVFGDLKLAKMSDSIGYDPNAILADYHLLPSSPCINNGVNWLNDVDGSISDIGLYTTDTLAGILDTGNVLPDMLSGVLPKGTYTLKSNCVIPDGVTVVIEKGVHIKASQSAGLIVSGTLKINGEKSDSVYFDALDENGWDGIVFDHADTGTTIKYLNLSHTNNTAIKCLNSNIVIQYSNIHDNKIPYPITDGGAFYIYQSKADLSNCTIENNFINNDNGIGAGVSSSESETHITNCIIRNNTIKPLVWGFSFGAGIIFYNDTSSEVTNCLIAGNIANGSGSGGGAIYIGTSDSIFLKNNFIYGNIANRYGNAILVDSSKVYATGNCIAKNGGYNEPEVRGDIYIRQNSSFYSVNNTIAKNLYSKFGSVYVDNSKFYAYNTIFWQNLVRDSGEIYLGDTISSAIVKNCIVTKGLSDVYGGNSSKISSETISSVDPLFRFAYYDSDFVLIKGSPAIDAGAIPEALKFLLEPIDLNGIPRILGKAIDIGAYEYFDSTGTNSLKAQLKYFTCKMIPLRNNNRTYLQLSGSSIVGKDAQINIYNTAGRIVYTRKVLLSKTQNTIPLSKQLARGVYIVKLSIGNMISLCQTFSFF